MTTSRLFPPFKIIGCLFSCAAAHNHLLMVLELQAKVVALDEVHVGAHQVEQHFARGFLLQKGRGNDKEGKKKRIGWLESHCVSLLVLCPQPAGSTFCCRPFDPSDLSHSIINKETAEPPGFIEGGVCGEKTAAS